MLEKEPKRDNRHEILSFTMVISRESQMVQATFDF